MTPAFERLQKHLKQLPGLGFRSSERIALHLLVEKPARLPELVRALEEAAGSATSSILATIGPCSDWQAADRRPQSHFVSPHSGSSRRVVLMLNHAAG